MDVEKLLPICLEFISTLESFEKEGLLKFFNKCNPAVSSNMQQRDNKVFLIVLLQERFFKKMLLELMQTAEPFSSTCRYNFYPVQLFKPCSFILDQTYDVYNQTGSVDVYAGLNLLPCTLFSSNEEIEHKTINVDIDRVDMELFFEQAIQDNYSRVNEIWSIQDVLENMELDIDLEQFMENDDYVESLISDDAFLEFLSSQIIDLCNLMATLEELYIDQDALYKDVSSMILSLDFIDELAYCDIDIKDFGKSPIRELFFIICNKDFHYSRDDINLSVYKFPLIEKYYESKKQGAHGQLDEKIDFLLDQFKDCIKSSYATLCFNLDRGIVIFLFYDFYNSNLTSVFDIHVSIMFNIYLHFINTVIKIRNSQIEHCIKGVTNGRN